MLNLNTNHEYSNRRRREDGNPRVSTSAQSVSLCQPNEQYSLIFALGCLDIKKGIFQGLYDIPHLSTDLESIVSVIHEHHGYWDVY